jgi:uncharacterized protein (DUF1015 family)
VADVRPLRALRYSLDLDLGLGICPPFDTISPELQKSLHDRSDYNAVRIELADDSGGKRYERAAQTLAKWRSDRVLERDPDPAFYIYKQEFAYGEHIFTRRVVLARLGVVPWGEGVLPHEQTFGAPKEDRLKLLRATKLNASPVFLIYRDVHGDIARLLHHEDAELPFEMFETDGLPNGLTGRHAIWGMDDEIVNDALVRAFGHEKLYIADGHHRYETALAYRDEVKASASRWTGEELENFALVALAAANDPGLLVLPIHRVTNAAAPLADVRARIEALFDVHESATTADAVATIGGQAGAFGLIAEGSAPLVLTVKDAAGVDSHLPQDRSPAWRKLDYSIANHAILRHGLGLSEEQMSDYGSLWFTEDAEQAAADVVSGKGRYAVLLNPVPVTDVLDLADAGERMPQKSTFFYPKIPTGLAFNLLED